MAEEPLAEALAEHIAEQIARARRSAKLTQRELAERAGVTQAMVSRLEGGARLPRLETLLAIAGACGHALELRLVKPRGGRGATLRGS